jgi:dihydrofolate reductase
MSKIMTFEIIVACDLHGGIGKNGAIPWDIPEDRIRFKNITQSTDSIINTAVIMGRKTWESLKQRPLKNRINIVVSRKRKSDAPIYVADNSIWASSYEDAMMYCEQLLWQNEVAKVFIIGGESLYTLALNDPRVTKIHCTLVNTVVPLCDTYFPRDFMYTRFVTTYIEECKNDEYTWVYITLQRSE